MKVVAEKITDLNLLRRACEATMRNRKQSNVTLNDMYMCEHSPIRTQWFWLDMDDLPTFVSTHCVRHKIGVEHYVGSNRPDRGGDGKADRDTPINHSALVNAEALITMARKRLCYKASPETREMMLAIKEAIREVDPDLAKYMVPSCVYRGGICVEKPCGRYIVRRYNPVELEQQMIIRKGDDCYVAD